MGDVMNSKSDKFIILPIACAVVAVRAVAYPLRWTWWKAKGGNRWDKPKVLLG